MQSFFKFLSVLLVLGIGAGLYFLMHKKGEEFSEDTPREFLTGLDERPKTPVEVPVVLDVAQEESDPAARISINVHYPAIQLVQSPDIAKETNAIIATFVNDIVEDFREGIREIDMTGLPKESASDLTMRWSVLLAAPTMISLRLDYSAYEAGAAHPNNESRVFNFDFLTHKILETPDLFASSSDALPFLSQFSREALRKTFADLSAQEFVEQVMTGTTPTLENFHNVGITKEGLVIIFNPYQVAPYARGVITLPVSLDQLGSHIEEGVRKGIELARTNIVEAVPIE